jgi:hypothetical protein
MPDRDRVVPVVEPRMPTEHWGSIGVEEAGLPEQFVIGVA